MATRQNPPQVLRYPYEALTDSTDYLQINLIEKIVNKFEASSTLEKLTLTNRGKFDNRGTNQVQINSRGNNLGLATQAVKSGDIILLPMPSTINDTNQVSYSEDSLDAITATLAKEVGAITGTPLFDTKGTLNVTKINEKINEFFRGVDANLPLIKNLILTNLAGQAASLAGMGNLSINQAIARSSGQIINPNVELLFNGPTIRNFRFSFKMTPRNPNEANQIRAIIRSLKEHMSPRDSLSFADANTPGSNYFLTAPNIFELRYKKGSGNNLYLNRFKRCVLENMSVNYTGENVYATYPDGQPVSTVMDLSFKELEPIYASDYGTNEGKIGTGY
jgi:hypothetical protein